MHNGVLAGYPVTDVVVKLIDGSYHPVDSSELAFQIAASQALKKALVQAQPVILEPIMKVEITVPEDYLGDVLGDFTGRRGRIMGTDRKGHLHIIRALPRFLTCSVILPVCVH